MALASLPSLEESRIALWALRGVWSFYDIGPLEDVRLELAGNYDQFEPTDIGRCGEPYSPLPVCDKTYGLFIHGLTGLGVAGEVRPDNPWSDLEGIEGGARLEFRWDRYSFAVTDFYGFADLPYQDQLYVYSRNVDPATGRPRHSRVTGACTTGAEAACLQPVDDDPATPLPDNDALRFHSVNQQVFAMICATSVGLSPDLDPTACGQTVFNSHRDAITGVQVPDPLVLSVPTVSGLASNLIVGNEAAHILAAIGLTGGVAVPHVLLNQDPCDGFLPGPCDTTDALLQPNAFYQAGGQFLTMNQLLTVEQMAALGCGPFYSTNCEGDGVDLMNAEASALVQAWPGFEGAGGLDWDTTDPDVIQPGTLGFEGGPVCTRFEAGEIRILPGCRGPTYQEGTQIGGQTVTGSVWDPRIDGDPPGLVQPFFDPASPFFQGAASSFPQEFRSEMAALSFNALMALVALSSADDLDGDGVVDPTVAQFDPVDPFRADGCSFSRAHLCSNVQSIYQVTGLQRNTLRAGGSERFGRRDFVWQGGSPLALRYDKRNVLGFSMDFAEDRTKSSWGVEFTWVEGVTFADFDARDRTTTAQTFNTTISADRPTFINFLNANRTFFLNSQWFVQWVEGYRESFPSDGPWNVLATFTIQPGFFRDRFQSSMTFVYDFGSNSGAWLPSVTYRYTENFSVTFGAGVFAGRMASRDMALSPVSLGNRAGKNAYDDFVENGLSVVRERDELFLRVRYTF